MSDSPGRVSGSRRLRGDLARKVAKETAKAIYCMHGAGWVHGGKLSSSLFFWLLMNGPSRSLDL
jgi:acetyl esterase/lipase